MRERAGIGPEFAGRGDFVVRVERRGSREGIFLAELALDLACFPGELAALNLASRRPCPFSTPEFLSLLLNHDEFAAPGDELLLLLAYAGERLVGVGVL